MSNIDNYAIKPIINPNDKVIGTDSEVATTVSTKNFDFGNILGTDLTVFYNDTGGTITKCTPVSRGTTVVNDIAVGIVSDSTIENNAISYIGLAIADVPDGQIGYAQRRGTLKACDTSSLPVGFLYLGPSGTLVNVRPDFPQTRVAIGGVTKVGTTDGEITLDKFLIPRTDIGKSYGFTSQGIPSGTYWKAGFYDFESTDANLNEGATLVNFGSAGRAYAAHPAIVAAGPGTVVGGGQVGLRVLGIRDYEDGTPQQAGQIGIVTEDITTLVANNYYEAAEKFSGQIAFELYVVSGTPTAYSLDFNYGYAKYDDFQDRDVTITEFECVWQGNANDSNFDVALMHHTTTGWTYAATGFVPGNSDICRKSTDQPLAGDVDNNEDGAYKRTNLNFKVEGEGMDGVIIQVITGANNTIQTMDMHIGGVSEELQR